MKAKKISKLTTNRGEFNRAYKYALANKGLIRCSYCKYHKNENNGNNRYGYYLQNDDVKYPSWKLVSKNKKQWMKKNMVIKLKYFNAYSQIYFKFIW